MNDTAWFSKETAGAVVKSRFVSTDKDTRNHSAIAQLINASSADNHTIPKVENIAGYEVMTLQQLATYLCIPTSTIYRLVQTGRLPAFKVGRQWRVSLKAVQNYLLQDYEQKTGRRGSS